MNLGETNATLRRIFLAIYIADGSALATDAAVSPPVGSIKVCINGAAFVNATGTLVHVGSGSYYYEASTSEVATTGFLLVKYERVGYKTEMDWDRVGSIFSVGETDATRRRLPLTLFSSGNPPTLTTGATVAVATELQASVSGAAYANATGSLVEVGSGLYYYQAATVDVSAQSTLIVKYEKTGFGTTVTTTPVTQLSNGRIITLTPADGALLNVDPEIARFTPIVTTIQCNTGEKPYIFTTIGSLKWTIYDGTHDVVTAFFRDHTSVTSLGSDQYSITVLPNGGWWRSSIDVKFISGAELLEIV